MFGWRRYGRFQINRMLVQTHYSLIQKVMGEVLILRCEFMFTSNSFVYEAYSPHFMALSQGEALPDYGLWLNEIDKTFYFLRDEGNGWYDTPDPRGV